jgi:hypothetical protein
MKAILFAVATYLLSFQVLAATPAQVQAMIDAGQCEQALQTLAQEQQNNVTKQSTLLDVLFVDAALCAGKVTPDNAADVLAKLDKVKQTDPLLIGINNADFTRLTASVTDIAHQQHQDSGLMATLMKLVTALLLISGIAWVISFVLDRRASGNLGEGTERVVLSHTLDRKNAMLDKANQLRALVDNQREKASLRGDDAVANKLARYLNSVDGLLTTLSSADSISDIDLKSMDAKLSNWAVLVKTV